MEDADSKLNELARLANDAQKFKVLYEQFMKEAKLENKSYWKTTDDGKRSLVAMDSLINAIGKSMELSFELLGNTEDVKKLCKIIGHGSVKITKLNNNHLEKINEDGGIYETPAMVGFRETHYDKNTSKRRKQIAKANYNEDLSIVVIEKWLSLDKLLVATYGDEAVDILTPLITIFDANAKQKVQKRLDKNEKKRKDYHDSQAEKDENFVDGKSKEWWYKKGLERMNGMGVTQCTVVGDSRYADGGHRLHIERKFWRYTDDKTDVELVDR